MEVYLAAVHASGSNTSILSLILDADIIVQLTLFTLIFMSLSCWAIIIQKFFRLTTATRQSARFLKVFWESKRLDTVYEQSGMFKASPVAQVFKAGYQELAKVTSAGGKQADAQDNLTRTLRRATAVEQTNLERYITWLATTGATAPFIGLFGTVWGILRAFQKLGAAQQASIQVVGPDIAHALVATAVGLIAAIPAVMAFNFFSARLRVLSTEMDNFSADFLNMVKRHV
ncbi:MAG: protein TolQ [Deltaproteobacteria bacterium]|nr:MAG: protein TolQ [Deltaproteobacteria bacterium]